MNSFKVLIALILSIVFFSCKRKEPVYFDGFSRNAGGLYYKLITIGDSKSKLQFLDDVSFSCNYKKSNDSVFFSSANEKTFISVSDTLNANFFEWHLIKLSEGDSAEYLIKTKDFFRHYFQINTPEFCKNDSLIKVEVKINKIEKNKEIRAKNPNFPIELKQITNYIKHKNITLLKEIPNSIFIIGHQNSLDYKVVSVGKSITVSYKGWFLNDSLIDIPLYPMQFIYGTPDQLLEGLNFVINGMHKGETKKIILPSHLAYGKSGSSNGAVPPYTPLVYEIKILEVK